MADGIREGDVRVDNHREDVFTQALCDLEFTPAVFGFQRIRREQIDKPITPFQTVQDFLPPLLARMKPLIVPDLVEIQHFDDLYAIGLVDSGIANK